ncbi:transposase [Streptomyces sp. Q6]|uniref:Transposase n=1 Tax=Streptomyces citrinus TaxID=3118173 RepID=A0ACD5ALN2_9ACTN
MGSKYTKRYTEEFKRDAIALVDPSGKTVTAVACELGISSESLRGCYRKAKADQGVGAPDELTGAERKKLRRLRRENREQQQTIEILRKEKKSIQWAPFGLASASDENPPPWVVTSCAVLVAVVRSRDGRGRWRKLEWASSGRRRCRVVPRVRKKKYGAGA